MAHSAIYQDKHAIDKRIFAADMAYLSSFACAHLLTYLATPSSALTWDVPVMQKRIQGFLSRVYRKHPKVKPSAVIRALLAIARHIQGRPGKVVAFNDEAEVVFYVAFAKTGILFDKKFTHAVAKSLISTSAPEEVPRHFGFFRSLVNDAVEAELSKKNRDTTTTRVLAALEFWVAPHMGERSWRRLGGKQEMQCPSMPTTFSEAGGEGWQRGEEKLIFPVVPYLTRVLAKLELESIAEEDEDGSGRVVDSATLDTSSSDASLSSDTDSDSDETSSLFSSCASFFSLCSSMSGSSSPKPGSSSQWHYAVDHRSPSRVVETGMFTSSPMLSSLEQGQATPQNVIPTRAGAGSYLPMESFFAVVQTFLAMLWLYLSYLHPSSWTFLSRFLGMFRTTGDDVLTSSA